MTVKAAVIHEFGDVNVLKYEDIKTPTPKSGHILIKVLAAGVNRFDHYLSRQTRSIENLARYIFRRTLGEIDVKKNMEGEP